jgi:ABC-type nitrate/sulfonate/bicarbonate transport system ATPase subunit
VLLVTHDVEEAIVLADRVLVLAPDGHVCLDREVQIERPRKRGTPSFNALRAELLGELGVDEGVESGG